MKTTLVEVNGQMVDPATVEWERAQYPLFPPEMQDQMFAIRPALIALHNGPLGYWGQGQKRQTRPATRTRRCKTDDSSGDSSRTPTQEATAA